MKPSEWGIRKRRAEGAGAFAEMPAGLFMPLQEASQWPGGKAIASKKVAIARAPGMITCLGEDVRHVYVFDASISSTGSMPLPTSAELPPMAGGWHFWDECCGRRQGR